VAENKRVENKKLQRVADKSGGFAVNPFEVLVFNLSQLGFFGFLLPFILAFSIVFALLLKSKVLGEDKKIIGVISLVIAFFVIGFGGPALQSFLTTLFGIMIAVIAAILVVILILSMTGADISKLVENKLILFLILVAAIILSLLIGSTWNVRISSEIVAIILFVVILGIAGALVSGK